MPTDYVRLVGQRDKAKAENYELRRENARLRKQAKADHRHLNELREKRNRLVRKLEWARKKNRDLARRLEGRPPQNLTDLHAWWLERHTPEQIRDLAAGLAETD